jgi:hypothetical protein
VLPVADGDRTNSLHYSAHGFQYLCLVAAKNSELRIFFHKQHFIGASNFLFTSGGIANFKEKGVPYEEQVTSLENIPLALNL